MGRATGCVLGLLIGGASVVCAYALWVGRWKYAIAGFVLIAALVFSWRASERRRSRLAAFWLGLVVSVYAADAILAVAVVARPILAARQAGRPYDLRTYHRVVVDLRAQGIAALPAALPNMFRGSDRLPRPLAGVSSTPTVYCNESGEYLVYKSDRHGFHNSSDAWARSFDAAAPIVALGDSFVHGSCVPSDQNLVARLRETHPGALNLGMGSSGPLVELAIFREYVAELRPEVVLWFYFEGNDLSDLAVESVDPLLRRYRDDPAFRQGLIGRQPELDRLLVDRLEQEEFSKAEPLWTDCLNRRYPLRQALSKGLRLGHLRDLLFAVLDDPLDERIRPQQAQIPALVEIVKQASDQTSAWGGRFYLVALPGWSVVTESSPKQISLYSETLAALEAVGIPAIDVLPALKAGGPKEMFLFAGSHYTPRGYQTVVDVVLEEIASEEIRSR